MASIKTLRENSRGLFYSEVEKMINDDSKKVEKRGRRLKEAGDKITCFYCLDYEIVYKDREGAFANWDGRGDYDIVNCMCCRKNEDWISCSSSPTTTYPGIVKRGDRERSWIEGKAVHSMESLADKLEQKIGAL